MVGFQEMCKLVDHDISYELPVLLEKPVAEFQLAPFGKAFSPERFIITERDLLRHCDAALFEPRIHLVAKIYDKASDAAPSPLFIGHVFGAVVSGIGNFECDDAVFSTAGIFRCLDNLKNIRLPEHHEDFAVYILTREALGLLLIDDVVYRLQ